MYAHFYEAGTSAANKCKKKKALETSGEILLIKILSFDPWLHYTGGGGGNEKIRFERINNEIDKSTTVAPPSKPSFFFSLPHPWHPIMPKNEGLALGSETFWVMVTLLNFQLFIVNHNRIMKRREINDKDHL